MAIPLIVGGAIMAAGAAGTGIAAGMEAGRNNRRAGNFGNDPRSGYDPYAQFYNGSRDGKFKYTANLDLRRQQADARKAPQANYENADADRANAGLARQSQQATADMMYRRASGQTPSIASQQARQDMMMLQQGGQRANQQAAAAQASQAASARGAAGVAMAQQNAANNIANAQGQIGTSTAQAMQNISNQSQINAAQERAQAEQAAFGAYSGMRGGDQASQQQAAQQAQYNAGLEMMSRQASDQRAMSLENLEARANEAELNSRTQNNAILAGSYNASEGLNQQVTQANANRNAAWIEKLIPSDSGMKQSMDIMSLMKGGKSDSEGGGGDVYSQAGGKSGGGMDTNQMMGMAAMASKFMSPGEAKRPLSLQDMLDDRYRQENERGEAHTSALDEAMAAQVAQDREYAEQDRQVAELADRRDNDPAVGLERIAAYRRQQDVARDIDPGSVRQRSAETPSEGRYADLAPGTEDFERTEPKADKKQPWWMTPMNMSGEGFKSDERTKKTFTMSDEITAKQMEGRRSPKAFKRDAPADQKKVKDDYYANLSKQADDMMAGYKLSLAKGGSVALNEGELDDDKPDTRMASNSFASDDRAKLAAAYAEGVKAGMTREDDPPRESKKEAPAPERFEEDDYAEPPPIQYEVAPAVHELPPPKAPRIQAPAQHPEVVTSPGGGFQRAGIPRLPNWGEVRGRNRALPARMRTSMPSDEDTKKAKPLKLDRGALADANRAMIGTPYTYKPEFTPEHEREGQPHYGFMTQNLRKSPITSVAVEKDPASGMDHVDRDRMLQVVAAGLSDLQRQEDETRMMLRKGGRGR